MGKEGLNTAGPIPLISVVNDKPLTYELFENKEMTTLLRKKVWSVLMGTGLKSLGTTT
jgi:hypothetical protein